MDASEVVSLDERARAVASREDLVGLIAALVEDLRRAPQRWENSELGSYLETMAAWCADSPGFGDASREDDALPPWRIVADLLMAARSYE